MVVILGGANGPAEEADDLGREDFGP